MQTWSKADAQLVTCQVHHPDTRRPQLPRHERPRPTPETAAESLRLRLPLRPHAQTTRLLQVEGNRASSQQMRHPLWLMGVAWGTRRGGPTACRAGGTGTADAAAAGAQRRPQPTRSPAAAAPIDRCPVRQLRDRRPAGSGRRDHRHRDPAKPVRRRLHRGGRAAVEHALTVDDSLLQHALARHRHLVVPAAALERPAAIRLLVDPRLRRQRTPPHHRAARSGHPRRPRPGRAPHRRRC